MAKGRRDYQSEYARRNQLAQDAGWNTAGQERYARQKFRESPLDVQGKWNRFRFNHMELSAQDERKAFRSFWKGLIDPRTREDTGRNSPKAEWFVEWLELDMFHGDLDVWAEMYGDD